MINDIMINALGTKWNLTDDFETMFLNPKFQLSEIASVVGLDAQSLLDICVMNIDLPQLSADLDAVIHAREYRLNAKLHQPFTVSITFRDVLGLKLRDYFTEIWIAQQREYFNDIKSEIKVYSQRELIFESDM